MRGVPVSARDWRQDLEAVLREEIPLTQAMDLRVAEASLVRVVLTAPLEPNHNHKRTAFGGSLYSLAVLAGWGLLWIRLRDAGLDGHVVIAKSEAEYLRPVVEELRAAAEADEKVMATALELYRRKGKARVLLTARIGREGEEGLRFFGTYALVR
jgi:thioesterase domain-containing protein